MQIITKAFLIFLGLSAAGNLCNSLRNITFMTLNTSVFRCILFSFFVIILLIAVVYFLILKHDWLVYKITGPGEKLTPESEILWLTASLRIAAVLYGLILLSGSIMTILNIFYLRPLIDEIFVPKTCQMPRAVLLSQLLSTVCNLLEAVLAIYLLYGWPQFISYQLNLSKSKSSLDKKLSTEGIKNE